MSFLTAGSPATASEAPSSRMVDAWTMKLKKLRAFLDKIIGESKQVETMSGSV
jgi:hypothetical protein